MELSGILSLSLGLIAGVMFSIVYSKYEDYSTVHDVKTQPFLKPNSQGEDAKRDKLRAVMHAQRGVNTSRLKSEDENANGKTLDYAVGGTSFYFTFEPKSLPPIADENSERNLLLNEIASWQTFDPQYDGSKLKAELSVFCVITIGPSSIPQHGKASFHSWTTHCNDYVMLSSMDNKDYKVKNIGLPDRPPKAWERTKMAFSYAMQNHPNHDWYVKTDHDNFVVMENFRYMLLMHQTHIPGFAGHVIAGNQQRGTVIALSRQALVKALPAFQNCGGLFGGTEDFKELESCLKPAGITSNRDGRDKVEANQFQMVLATPNVPLNAHKTVDWSWRYITNPQEMGTADCCKDYPVSFHYVSPNGLYLMEYVVYHMRPFGIGTYVCPTKRDSEGVPVDGGRNGKLESERAAAGEEKVI